MPLLLSLMSCPLDGHSWAMSPRAWWMENELAVNCEDLEGASADVNPSVPSVPAQVGDDAGVTKTPTHANIVGPRDALGGSEVGQAGTCNASDGTPRACLLLGLLCTETSLWLNVNKLKGSDKSV